ncbi:MAG: outer membrane protein assembly factor BamE [bacterium]
MSHSLVFAFSLLTAPLAAQQVAHTVAPGMTKSQVVSALGQPAISRTVSDFTYMFYTNSCGKTCGMNDLVVLHGDSVVDAIFRSPSRHYTGTSSSPSSVSAGVAAHKNPAATNAPVKEPAKPAATPATKPTQMKPGKANDTRPSIPVNPPAVKPAPTTKPATKSP